MENKPQEELQAQLDRIEKSVKQIRSYLFWTMIITVAVIVLPLLGLIFVIPQFLSIYSDIGI